MAIFSLLADLIRQCRRARWEEEHCTVEAVELDPLESISYVRLLCIGQVVKFKVCSSGPVAASIGLDSPSSLAPVPEPFEYNPELTCCVLERLCLRTDYYRLAVENHGDSRVSATVEIHAEVRGPCARTRLEHGINFLVGLLRLRRRFAVVTSVESPPESDDRSSAAHS